MRVTRSNVQCVTAKESSLIRKIQVTGNFWKKLGKRPHVLRVVEVGTYKITHLVGTTSESFTEKQRFALFLFFVRSTIELHYLCGQRVSSKDVVSQTKAWCTLLQLVPHALLYLYLLLSSLQNLSFQLR